MKIGLSQDLKPSYSITAIKKITLDLYYSLPKTSLKI